jgi:hypothetical protein
MRDASKLGTGVMGKPASSAMFRLVIIPLLLGNRLPTFINLPCKGMTSARAGAFSSERLPRQYATQ